MDKLPSLDHIILLVPDTWHSKPPAALAQAFHLYAGGAHADGKTRNTLIILESGVYLELISFVPPEDSNREGHWWGAKAPGLIDWALTSGSAADVQRARDALHHAGCRFTYDPPRPGGRVRPDGAVLQWEVTFPAGDVQRGDAPFWCHDVTPRDLRVPAGGGAALHPSGALGVDRLVLVVRPGDVRKWAGAYEAITGAELVQDERLKERGAVALKVPQANADSKPVTLVVQPPQDAFQEKLVEKAEVAIAEIVVDSGNRKDLPESIDEKVIENGGFRIHFSIDA